MSTLGKILLFINLLAAAGVAYLASQSWAQRQAVNATLLKHELVESGLPLTNDKGTFVDSSKPDALITLSASVRPGSTLGEIRAKLLLDLFSGAKREGATFQSMNSNPPLSVMAELEEVKKQVDAAVAGAGANRAQGVAFLVGTFGADLRLVPGPLAHLADDFEERFILREWLADVQNPQAPFHEWLLKRKALNAANPEATEVYWNLARAALDRKFDEAISPVSAELAGKYHAEKLAKRELRTQAFDAWMKAPIEEQVAKREAYFQAQLDYWQALVAKTASTSETDRRRKAGVLLLSIDPSAGGQKRTALILGLPDYTASLLDRLRRLNAMPDRYDRQQELELQTFVLTYEQRLATSRELDRMVERQRKISQGLAASEKASMNETKVRETQRDVAKARVEAIAKRVASSSINQAELEKELVALQQLAADQLSELFALEDRVQQSERKLSPGK